MPTLNIPTESEVIYPVKTDISTNAVIQRTDKSEWTGGLKNASLLIRRTSTIGFRIKRSEFSAFMGELRDYYDQEITVSLPGLDPFLVNQSTFNAYILGYNKPVREAVNMYRIDVRFRYIS